ncbi:MAG TPA: homoserine kinase [Actinomycetota bacterium]
MRLTVRVPATSANLGPGFDCFGLALDLCNEVTVDTGAAPGVAWEGEGASELPTDGSDLVSHVMASVAEVTGGNLPPMRLDGLNRIPLERGLGSSSAAAVAGAAIALRILGEAATPDAVFGHAARIEGHPDNAGPAVFGGFTIALPDGTVHRFDPHPDLHPVALVPGDRLPTAEARRALPGDVPREDAVFNVAHAALTVEALTRDPSLLGEALQDRLHQDARLALVPAVLEVFRALQGDGVPVCVSGAGPTLLAFPREPLAVPEGWRVIEPGIRSRGFELAEG